MRGIDELVGRNIREVRKQLKLSQKELADELGWQQPKLSRTESGTTPLTVSELVSVANTLGRSAGHFLPRGDSSNLSSLEEHMLDLFRQLADIGKLAAINTLVDIRDDEEMIAEGLIMIPKVEFSSRYRQLLRWAFKGKESDVPADTSEESFIPDVDIPEDLDETGQPDEEPFYAPYSEEMEMREFKRLVLDLGHDLREIYSENRWAEFSFQKYEDKIAELQRRYSE